MPPSRYIIETDQGALAGAHILNRAPAGSSVRLAVVYEPEEDGTPAVGYYVEAFIDDHWRCVSDGLAPSGDHAMEQLRRIERLAMAIDPRVSLWIREFGANL
jgi:hypothetical protein